MPEPQQDEETDQAVEVNKWDGNAVKNALDDAVRKLVSDKYDYSEKTGLMDGRLGISGVAVGFALFALLWDWLHPFPASRPVLIACVLSYFALMGILQLYTWFVEKGIFYIAIDQDPTGKSDDKIIQFSSKLKRFDHMYQLEIVFQQGQDVSRASLEKSVAEWVDENGNISMDILGIDALKLHDSLLPSKKRN